MASFFEELWNSIFTPGPTSTLLVATNATFAVLQALLLALLVFTYSVHFAVLSVLSGGLWISINWFARELQQSAELAEVRKREAAANANADSDGDDTETEGSPAVGRSSTLRPAGDELTNRRSLAESGTDSEWDKVDDVSAEE